MKKDSRSAAAGQISDSVPFEVRHQMMMERLSASISEAGNGHHQREEEFHAQMVTSALLGRLALNARTAIG